MAKNSNLQCKSKQLKAQVATEFMLYVSAFMFVVIAAFISISYIQAAEIPTRESALVKEAGEGFANAVTLAATSGRGFSYNYTFPRTVLNKEYKIIFDKDNARLLINWPGTYNEFTYVYPVVATDYDFEGGCIDEVRRELLSTKCANKIDIYNNGEKLIIYRK